MSLYPPDLEDTDPDDVGYPPDPIRGRARVLFVAAAGPLFIGYATVVVLLALVIAVATRAHVSTGGVLSAAMPGWLAAYQVPLTIGGYEFGALPLLPTILVALLVGRAAANAAERLDILFSRDTIPIIATIAAVHAIAGGVLAEVTGSASFVAGVLVPAAVAGVAAAIGLARRGYFEDVVERLDELLVHGLRAGLIGLAAVLGIGGLLFLFGLATSLPTVNALFSRGAGDAVGLFLLSVGYVPNAVVAGTSFAAGPGVTLGGLSADPLYFSGGPLPGVPVLAALPESGAVWWPVVFLLPLCAGGFVGWVLRDASEDPIARLRAVGAAAVVVAVGCVVLGVGSGGQLADGVFDPLSVHPWSLGMAMTLWIALPAATVAWWAGPRLELTPSRSLLADAVEAEEAAAVDETEEDSEEEAEVDAAEDATASEQEIEDGPEVEAGADGEESPDASDASAREAEDPPSQAEAPPDDSAAPSPQDPDLPEEIEK